MKLAQSMLYHSIRASIVAMILIVVVEGAYDCNNVTTSAGCCSGSYNCFSSTQQKFCAGSSLTCNSQCGATCTRCSWCSSVGYCQPSGTCAYSTCPSVPTQALCTKSTSCTWCATLGYCMAASSSSSCVVRCSNFTTQSGCSATTACSWCATLGGYCHTKSTGTLCAANCTAFRASNSSSCMVAPQCQWCSPLGGYCAASERSCDSICQDLDSSGNTSCAAMSLCHWCPQHNGRCKLLTEPCVTSTLGISWTTSRLKPTESTSMTGSPSWIRTPTPIASPTLSASASATLEASPTYHRMTIFHTPTNSSSNAVSRSDTMSNSAGSSQSCSATSSMTATPTTSFGSPTEQVSLEESRTRTFTQTSTLTLSEEVTITASHLSPQHSLTSSLSSELASVSSSAASSATVIVITNTSTRTRRSHSVSYRPLSRTSTHSVNSSATASMIPSPEVTLSHSRSTPLYIWPVASYGSTTVAALVSGFAAVLTGTTAGGLGVGGTTLAAVSMISCSAEHFWTADGLQRFLLSLWYDVGPVASVWGNIGIAIGVAALHRFVVSVVLRSKRQSSRQAAGGKGRSKSASAAAFAVATPRVTNITTNGGVGIKRGDVGALQFTSDAAHQQDQSMEAQADVRFPSVSIAVMLFLMPGTLYASTSCFAASDQTDHIVSGALGIVISAAAAMLVVRHVVCLLAERTARDLLLAHRGNKVGAGDDRRVYAPPSSWLHRIGVLAPASPLTAPSQADWYHMVTSRRYSVLYALPTPTAAAVGVVLLLQFHGAIFALVAGIPFREHNASCRAQYGVLGGWMLLPVVVMCVYRCCRGAFPLPIPIMNPLVMMASLLTIGLIVAVAVLVLASEDQRDSANNAISGLGWTLVVLHAAQAVVIIANVVHDCMPAPRVGDESPRHNVGGDDDSYRRVDADFLEGEEGMLIEVEDSRFDRHSDEATSSGRPQNWLEALQPPSAFYLGVPSSIVLRGSGSVGGNIHWRTTAWYAAVPLDTKLEVARLDALICGGLVAVEPPAASAPPPSPSSQQNSRRQLDMLALMIQRISIVGALDVAVAASPASLL